MPDYAVFGGCLRADITFPELCETTGRVPDWTFRTVDHSDPHPDAECLGDEPATKKATVRSFKWPSGWRLEYDDTGIFDISGDGRDITWWPRPDASTDLARIDVIGRVLAMAMHASGMLCLHGSCVALGDEGIAFVAPKLHGKSTIALALAKAGGRLMNDDTVPVDITVPPMVRPGAHRIRLWSDSVDRLGGDALKPEPAADKKFNIGYIPDEYVMHHAVPLAAVYLLTPVPAESEAAVTRTALPPVPSAIAMVRHAKLGALLGKSESTVLLDRAIALASTAPVYTLEVVRDFDRIDEVVAQLLEWHHCQAPLSPVGAAR